MYPRLLLIFLLLVAIPDRLFVDSHPQDVLLSDKELDNFSVHIDDPELAQLEFNSEISPDFSNIDTGTEPEPLSFNSNDIFATAEDLPSPGLISLVQNPSFCETMDDSRAKDDITYMQQLQARKNKPSSCPSSTFPTNKSPAREMIKPGEFDDEEEFNFNTFLENTSIPDLFQDDDEVCPSSVFGLSNIPVCDNLLFSSAVVLPGQDWVTLYDVYTYRHNLIPCIGFSKLWCCREVVAQEADSSMHGNIDDFDVSRLSDEYKNYFANFLKTTYNAYYCYPHS